MLYKRGRSGCFGTTVQELEVADPMEKIVGADKESSERDLLQMCSVGQKT